MSTPKSATRWRFMLVGSSLVVAVGLVITLARSHTESSTDLGDQTGDAERRLAKLESELRILRGNMLKDAPQPKQGPLLDDTAPQATAHPEPLDAPGAEDAQVLSPRERLEAERRRAEEARAIVLQELNDRVDTEPLDPTWRVETERSIHRVVPDHLGPNVELEEVLCASTLCRVGLSHPQQERIPNEEILQLVHDEEGLGHLGMSFDYSEKGYTTLYLRRNEGR